MSIIAKSSTNLSGKVRCLVVKDGSVVRETDWQHNLLLNQGMDNVATLLYPDLFLYCAAGTGNTPTEDDSGAITASQSGTTVTFSAPFITDTGTDTTKVIKWDSGEEAMIDFVTSTTVCEVFDSKTVSSDQFTIYRTNQQGLTTEVKRSNTYLLGATNTETTRIGSKVTHRRTFDFTAESGSVVYSEIGFSAVGAASTNLNVRIKLISPVTVNVGEQLRVIYDFGITLSPTTAQAITAVINNWPVSPATNLDGDQQIEMAGLAAIDPANGLTNGAVETVSSTNVLSNEPSVDVVGFLTDSSAALQTFPTTAIRATLASDTTAINKDSYSSLSFVRTKSGTFATSNGNGTDIRSLGYGLSIGTDTYSVFRLLFDQAQTKAATHGLFVSFRFTWTRELA